MRKNSAALQPILFSCVWSKNKFKNISIGIADRFKNFEIMQTSFIEIVDQPLSKHELEFVSFTEDPYSCHFDS